MRMISSLRPPGWGQSSQAAKTRIKLKISVLRLSLTKRNSLRHLGSMERFGLGSGFEFGGAFHRELLSRFEDVFVDTTQGTVALAREDSIEVEVAAVKIRYGRDLADHAFAGG